MKNYLVFACLFSAITFTIYGQQNFREQGYATYYSDIFHGRKTASGQVYNKNELVCAHKTLPFNTFLKVTNLSNQKSVIVKVIDRGPYGGKNYIIDLSRAAAKQLDMLQSGVVRVSIEVVKPESPSITQTSSDTIPSNAIKPTEYSKSSHIDTTQWRKIGIYDLNGTKVKPSLPFALQVGYYQNPAAAIQTAQNIMKNGYRKIFIQVIEKNKVHFIRVLLGNYENETVAKKNKMELEKKGIQSVIYKF